MKVDTEVIVIDIIMLVLVVCGIFLCTLALITFLYVDFDLSIKVPWIAVLTITIGSLSFQTYIVLNNLMDDLRMWRRERNE